MNQVRPRIASVQLDYSAENSQNMVPVFNRKVSQQYANGRNSFNSKQRGRGIKSACSQENSKAPQGKDNAIAKGSLMSDRRNSGKPPLGENRQIIHKLSNQQVLNPSRTSSKGQPVVVYDQTSLTNLSDSPALLNIEERKSRNTTHRVDGFPITSFLENEQKEPKIYLYVRQSQDSQLRQKRNMSTECRQSILINSNQREDAKEETSPQKSPPKSTIVNKNPVEDFKMLKSASSKFRINSSINGRSNGSLNISRNATQEGGLQEQERLIYLEDDEEVSQFFAQSRSNYTVSPTGSALNTHTQLRTINHEHQDITEIAMKSIDFDEGRRAFDIFLNRDSSPRHITHQKKQSFNSQLIHLFRAPSSAQSPLGFLTRPANQVSQFTDTCQQQSIHNSNPQSPKSQTRPSAAQCPYRSSTKQNTSFEVTSKMVTSMPPQRPNTSVQMILTENKQQKQNSKAKEKAIKTARINLKDSYRFNPFQKTQDAQFQIKEYAQQLSRKIQKKTKSNERVAFSQRVRYEEIQRLQGAPITINISKVPPFQQQEQAFSYRVETCSRNNTLISNTSLFVTNARHNLQTCNIFDHSPPHDPLLSLGVNQPGATADSCPPTLPNENLYDDYQDIVLTTQQSQDYHETSQHLYTLPKPFKTHSTTNLMFDYHQQQLHSTPSKHDNYLQTTSKNRLVRKYQFPEEEDPTEFEVLSSESDSATKKFSCTQSVKQIAKPQVLTARRRDRSCESDISEVASEEGGVMGKQK
ncbi:hypothetical protein FGO68_gene8632 [Halteria grandinella]|uniref:Uncharacterized protein n=1 Tax=Halteria grandinella TaxID=5974 RepID=A0A8J8NV25_HALGN|nr:hypothetical protein FGO68_gene8632 [Halteria grandinella]